MGIGLFVEKVGDICSHFFEEATPSFLTNSSSIRRNSGGIDRFNGHATFLGLSFLYLLLRHFVGDAEPFYLFAGIMPRTRSHIHWAIDFSSLQSAYWKRGRGGLFFDHIDIEEDEISFLDRAVFDIFPVCEEELDLADGLFDFLFVTSGRLTGFELHL